jgi:hypothetical protein
MLNVKALCKSLQKSEAHGLHPQLHVQRRLSASLKAAYGEEAWEYMPHSYTIPTEMAEWKAWLDEQAAAGADPGPWMLKTAQHLGKGLVLLPGAAAYTAATQPRCATQYASHVCHTYCVQ